MIVKHIGLAETNELYFPSNCLVFHFNKKQKKNPQNIIKQMTSVTTVIGDVGKKKRQVPT